MVLEYECAACAAELQSAETLLGGTARCPQCGTLLYLATSDAPLPRLCDMLLGPEPLVVSPRRVERAVLPAGAPAAPVPDIPDETGGPSGGVGVPRNEGLL